MRNAQTNCIYTNKAAVKAASWFNTVPENYWRGSPLALTAIV